MIYEINFINFFISRVVSNWTCDNAIEKINFIFPTKIYALRKNVNSKSCCLKEIL